MGGGKKGQLGQDGVKQYPFGDLNPVKTKPTAPAGDPNGQGAMGMMRRAAQAALTGDARGGTSKYKAIVLRRNPDIVDAATTPKNSWLASFFGSPGDTENSEQIPEPLQSYQLFIPELHAQLPLVKRYIPFDVQDPEHEKIDRYPTFIGSDSSLEQAAEGDLVWASFGNVNTFEDPTYLGPVFPKPGPGAHGAKPSASDACNKSCGGGGGGSGGTSGYGGGGPSAYNGPMPAPGEGLEYMKKADALALKNAGKVYKAYRNMAYAPISAQKKTNLSDPVKGQAKAYYKERDRLKAEYAAGNLTKQQHREAQAKAKASCAYCFVISPMPSVMGNGAITKSNGGHGYGSGFLKYMQQGGRGTAVSGRIGPGSCSQLPTQLERILMAQRISVEDQCGRGYGWGGKSWNYQKGGIDCTGFCFLHRCMVEVMISKDLTKLDGFKNKRFVGYTGKGCPDGSHQSSVPSGCNLDQHWSPWAYGGNGRSQAVTKKLGGTRSNSPSGGGSYTLNAFGNYRRGLWECVSVLGNDKGDPNTPWTGQFPLMPGDEIFSANRRKSNPSGSTKIQHRTSGKKDSSGKCLGITHIMCAHTGPDGTLRVAESGGPFGGVGSRDAGSWYTSMSKWANLFVFQPEEMATAWAECVSLCESNGIKHYKGRPLVPWTPDIAKVLAPTLFGKLPEMGNLDKQAVGETKTTDQSANPPASDRSRSSKMWSCGNVGSFTHLNQDDCAPTERKTRTTEKAAGSESINPPPVAEQPAGSEEKKEGEEEKSLLDKIADLFKGEKEECKVEKLKEMKAKIEALAEKIKEIQYGLGRIKDRWLKDDEWIPLEDDPKGEKFWTGRGDFAQADAPADLAEKEQTETHWCFVWRNGFTVIDDDYDGKEIEKPDVPRLTEEYFFGPEDEAQEKMNEKGLIFGWKYADVRGDDGEDVRKELIKYYDEYAEDVEKWLEAVTEQLKEAEEQKASGKCNPEPTGTGQVGSGSGGTAPCIPGAGGPGGGVGSGGGGGPPHPAVVDNGSNPEYAGEGENMPLSQPKAKLVKVYFDNIRYDFCAGKGGGGKNLREDVANDLSGVMDIVHNLGGIICQVGTGRNLSTYDPTKTNRSTTSFHYTYLAFDLYTHAASLYYKSDPNICEYVLTASSEKNRSGNYLFDIWARSDKPAGTEYKGHRVERRTLPALICKASGPARTVDVTGNFIMLTKIFTQFGFHRIGGRKKWYTNCKSGAASEWWHVQSHNKTYQGKTTWEECLKTVHSDSKVECSPPYKHRRRVFRGKGFTGSSKDDASIPRC